MWTREFVPSQKCSEDRADQLRKSTIRISIRGSRLEVYVQGRLNHLVSKLLAYK